MAVDVYKIFYLNGMDWINLNWIAESSKVATPFWGKVLSVMTYCEREWLAPKDTDKGDLLKRDSLNLAKFFRAPIL